MNYYVNSTNSRPQQANRHVCLNCGAKIDIIFDKCIFCQTPLPAVDYQRLSNEEIIANAGEWIGKSKGDSLIIPNPDNNANYNHLPPTITLPINIAIGNADKYLNILHYRTLSNPDLLPVYQSLSSLQRRKGPISENANNAITAVATCVMLIAICLGIFGAIYYDAKMTNRAIDKETARLEAIMHQVDKAMSENDYRQAEYLAAKINWQIDGSKHQEAWKDARFRVLEAIGNMKASIEQSNISGRELGYGYY